MQQNNVKKINFKGKDDINKLPLHLLPFDSLEELAKVMQFGAKKYGSNTWQLVENGKQRYFAACLRHLFKHGQGEFLDSEDNLSHLAHAFTNLAFLIHLYKENKDD